MSVKLKTFLILVALAVVLIPQAGAQNNNHTLGTVVSWGDEVLPYITPGTRFQAIALGQSHSLALKSGGTVVAWGADAYGQTDTPTNLTSVVAVAAGYNHSLALKSVGTVIAWGDNSYGQTNVPANLSGVIAIAAGAHHNLALKSDGTVVGWGYDAYGQTNVPVNLSGVSAIAAGEVHSLALKTNGTVVAWGGNNQGQSIVPANLSGVIAIAAGEAHSLALKSDGTVVAWGWNNFGQSTVPANLTNIIAIAAGGNHSLALKSDGTVVAWGYNGFGQSPVPANLNGVIAIADGYYCCLVLKSDGTVFAWGYNGYGECTVPGSLNSVIAIAAGRDRSLALKSDGTVAACADNYSVPTNLNGVIAIADGDYHSLALKSDGTVVAWGDNSYGETNVPGNLSGVIGISAGEYFSLALKSDGTVVAWGDNSYGKINVPANLNSVISIAAGGGHSVALMSDGTVVNWGPYYLGPYPTSLPVPANLNGVIAIAAGWNHSLALKSDGTVVAWGADTYGQTDIPTNLNGVITIAAGGDQSLAFKSDGTVVPWGQLLANSYVTSTVPANLSNVIAIAAGVGHSLALVAQSNQSPSIVSQPSGQTIQAESNVSFAVTASGYPSPNYQWQFNGQNIAGQTAPSLSLANVQFANAGGYLVVVTNAYGCVTSAVAQLTVFTNLVLNQTIRTPQITEIGNPTIPTDPTHFKVFNNGTFQSGVALDPTKMTVVLTHGWNASPNDWAAYTAQIIQQRIGINTVNIVAWDWSADAQSDFLHLTEIAAKTPGEGQALGADLVTALGANYSQRIHFIGHSLGTLVNAAAANYVHSHGFSWANTQMTLCDEAEIASGVGANGLWQFTTTLPETAVRLIQNVSTTEPYWGQALPNQFAWADNYISACGLLHPEAANAILNYTYPGPVGDMNTFLQEFYNFHDYAHYFYEDTIEPGIFNTGGQINATYMGFICSFEGGGIAQRPAANTVFYQNPNGLELNLAQTDWTSATSLLNARLNNFLGASVSSGINVALNTTGNAVGQVNGQIQSAGQNLENMVLNFFTSVSGGSLVQTSGAHPLGGPVPLGGSAGNTPAYAWIPLTIPSNAVSMSFNFMLQGNGNQDSFQAALQGTNILSLETSLIQTNVTLNSGLINVSQYAGTNVALFLGIVGGTSTNAQLTVSDIQFYSVTLPALQAQASGGNLMLSWPLSAQNFGLQTTTNLGDPNSWVTLTNTPTIVNLQNAVTNPVSGGAQFYRLKQ